MVEPIDLAKDATMALLSTSALLLTLTLTFVPRISTDKLMLGTMAFFLYLTVTLSSLNLFWMTFEKSELNRYLYGSQFVTFAVGLGLTLVSILYVALPPR